MKRINDRKQRRQLYAIMKSLRKKGVFLKSPEARKELRQALGF